MEPSTSSETMDEIVPSSVEELAEALGDCGSARRSVELGGNFTKRPMGGEIAPADVTLSTRRLTRVVAYEPKDLTISVEAGLAFRELTQILGANGQMLPLDPPFSDRATVGGVVATNSSGPRRRRYGTARDMVIGMKACTLEGKIVQSGGMVVKNVTGLDMAKLMIGSFGTLAAMATLNFKIFPCPAEVGTFVFSCDSLEKALDVRREILGGVLQPIAIDLMNAEAVRDVAPELPPQVSLILEVGGNRATVKRFENEFHELAKKQADVDLNSFGPDEAAQLWRSIGNLTPAKLAANPSTAVIRISGVPTRIREIFASALSGSSTRPLVVRAGAAVGYVYCADVQEARDCIIDARSRGLSAVVEYAPVGEKRRIEQWAEPGPELEIMRRIKKSLDPDFLLNRGRLFNRI